MHEKGFFGVRDSSITYEGADMRSEVDIFWVFFWTLCGLIAGMTLGMYAGGIL